METITLRIPGAPVAKARPKFFRRGEHVGTYKTNSQRAAEDAFSRRVQQRLKELGVDAPIPSGVPLRITCWFVMPVPKSSTKRFHERCMLETVYHVKRPDTDNLVKFVKDCLNNVVWHDDSQVSCISAMKVYGEKPGTVIKIEVMEAA